MARVVPTLRRTLVDVVDLLDLGLGLAALEQLARVLVGGKARSAGLSTGSTGSLHTPGRRRHAPRRRP
jgi:hypothetical protein